MPERERLIELIGEAHESWLRYVDECAFNQMALSFTFEQMFADHLLANKEQFIAKAKTEAVREFAEALVDTADIIQVDSFHYEYRISGDGIDDLVKKRSEEAYKALEERKEK